MFTTAGTLVATPALWPGVMRANEPVLNGMPPSIWMPVGGATYRSDNGRLATELSEMVVKPVVVPSAGAAAYAVTTAAVARLRPAATTRLLVSFVESRGTMVPTVNCVPYVANTARLTRVTAP